jgi:hypothetical protein
VAAKIDATKIAESLLLDMETPIGDSYKDNKLKHKKPSL